MYQWSLNGGRVAGDPDEWLPSNLMRFHWELLERHLYNIHWLVNRNPSFDEYSVYTVLVGAYRIPVGFVPFRARLARVSGGPQRIGEFVGNSYTEIFVRLVEKTAQRLFFHLPDELRAVAPQRESGEFLVRATAIAERLRDRDSGLPLSWSKIDFADLATRIDGEVLACSDIERNVYPTVYDEEDMPRPSNVRNLLYCNYWTHLDCDPELLFAANPFPYEGLKIISRGDPNHMGPNDWVGHRLRGAIPDHLLAPELLEAVRRSRRTQTALVPPQPSIGQSAILNDATETAPSGDDVTISDGPFGVNGFSFRGTRIDIPPKPWKLLDELWKAPRRTLDYYEILATVWGDPNIDYVTYKTIQSHCSALRKLFRDNAIPFDIKTGGDPLRVELVIEQLPSA